MTAKTSQATSHATSHAATQAAGDTSLAAIIVTAFLGLSLVFVAGFAHSEVMHDAAHDTRHAVGFPCH